MACALLTLMALNHEGAGLDAKEPMTMILSNQNNAAFASAGQQSGLNHLAVVTFGWTNQSIFAPSMRFTRATNFTN
jgi:hypothetical protein